MHEDAFQLTPHDVRAQEFQRAMRGFDPQQVESFKQRIAEELDRLLRERLQLEERLKGMVEQLRAFRDRERAMNDALIAAQQLREDIQAAAGKEAEGILKEARLEAQRLQEDARRDAVDLRTRNDGVRRQFAGYVSGFRALLERQLAELEGLAAAAGEDGALESEGEDG